MTGSVQDPCFDLFKSFPIIYISIVTKEILSDQKYVGTFRTSVYTDSRFLCCSTTGNLAW